MKPHGTFKLLGNARRPAAEPMAPYALCDDRSDRIVNSLRTQILEGDDPVFNWVSGTALRPLMAALDQDEQAKFANDYKEALVQAYPRRGDGKTLFPFRRIFMVIQK